MVRYITWYFIESVPYTAWKHNVKVHLITIKQYSIYQLNIVSPSRKSDNFYHIPIGVSKGAI